MLAGITPSLFTYSLFLFAVGWFAAWKLASRADKIGAGLGVIDRPGSGSSHKRHENPTPAVGGVIAFAAGILVCLASALFGLRDTYLGDRQEKILWVFSIFALMLMGLIDDRRHLSAIVRLFSTTFIFFLVVYFIPSLRIKVLTFSSLRLSIFLGSISIPFTVLSLLVLKNAINLADGRNGLVLGLSLIWTGFFLAHAPLALAPVICGMFGVLLAVFYANIRGRLFLGDCGAYGIAAYFGMMALQLQHAGAPRVRTAECVLLFLIPVADMLRLFFVRIALGRSPLKGDSNHLHHLLEKRLGWKAGWWVYMTIVATPLLMYQAIPNHGIQLILMVLITYGGLVTWLKAGESETRTPLPTSDPTRYVNEPPPC
jgi:UDP-GlcNAc:undecaprenyl-phosphate GlcNAc-1-phosphate transferase